MWIIYDKSKNGRPCKAFKSKKKAEKFMEENKFIRLGQTLWKDELNNEYGMVFLFAND